uniref:Uncharacterized protein n=1 Tax=Rhizophora mucronata TaxID=61149 RepID=A0A2P2QR67_RHIMU
MPVNSIYLSLQFQ